MGEYSYESILHDGKYLYQGVMDYHDLQDLLAMANERGLTAVSVNEYISWLIRKNVGQNLKK